MQIVLMILRIFVSYIFVVSGWAKIKQQSDFEKIVHSYQILPKFVIKPFTVTLPLIKITLGILFGLGLFTRITAIVIISLLCLFLSAIIINLIKGKSIPCGCSGKLKKSRISWNLVIRDLTLIIVLASIYYFNGGKIGLDYFLTKVIKY
jgi:putative oxidoreductase